MLNHTSAASRYHSAPIIGYHRAPLSQKFGAPRQPNLVALSSIIEMIPPYDTPAAFVGLADFSHIWISWQCHHNHIHKAKQPNNNNDNDNNKRFFRTQVRPPRLGGNQKIGVFASRSLYRPSGLGLSVVKLERVEAIAGRVLLMISGADMIDGTPIIDIKPYVAYSDAYGDAASGFATTAPTVLVVDMTEMAIQQFMDMITQQAVPLVATKNGNSHNQDATVAAIYQQQQQIMLSDIALIKALIAQDPRPAYRRDELKSMFTMRYKSIDVRFWQVEQNQLQIIAVLKGD